MRKIAYPTEKSRQLKVGNLSPKGWSALADSEPVFGRKLVLPTGWYPIALRTQGQVGEYADATFRRKVAYPTENGKPQTQTFLII
jgi:hypothetical protein